MSGPFFQRFRWNDAAALARELDDTRAAHATARATGDLPAEVDNACRLGNALIAADREAEAAELLEDALAKARTLSQPEPQAWVLLYLATARQYLGERPLAQTLFQRALDLAAAHGLREVEHYTLHHRGRCYAEQRDVERARAAFEAALKIRLELGEPRAERSRQALIALDSF